MSISWVLVSLYFCDLLRCPFPRRNWHDSRVCRKKAIQSYDVRLLLVSDNCLMTTDITKVFRTYQTFLYFCRNLNMFIKKKLKYFTRPKKQISPDLSGVSGDFRIVCDQYSALNVKCTVYKQKQMFKSRELSLSELVFYKEYKRVRIELLASIYYRSVDVDIPNIGVPHRQQKYN